MRDYGSSTYFEIIYMIGEETTLATYLPQLGLSGIFLAISWYFYKDVKDERRKNDDLNGNLLKAYIANTESNFKLADAVSKSADATVKNTESTEKLITVVREAMNGRRH